MREVQTRGDVNRKIIDYMERDRRTKKNSTELSMLAHLLGRDEEGNDNRRLEVGNKRIRGRRECTYTLGLQANEEAKERGRMDDI